MYVYVFIKAKKMPKRKNFPILKMAEIREN